MGLNSTATAYNFGQFGSTFLSGDGAILDLSQSDAKYYVCAITFVSATIWWSVVRYFRCW